MNIHITYEDTDIAKALSKIIKDPNSEEFVKLLTPMLCTSSEACTHFFKLLIGNKLPDVIPINTLCKLSVDNLGYGTNKTEIRKRYADDQDKVIVTVIDFRGFHDYSNYQVRYINIVDDKEFEDTCYTSARYLEVIEEF